MRINVTDTAKVTAALTKVQHLRTRRTLDVGHVTKAAAHAEARLVTAGIPQANRTGTRVHYDPHTVARSYGYSADGTQVTLERGTGSRWFLVNVERTYIHDRADSLRVTLPASITAPDLATWSARANGLTLAAA